MSHRQSVHWVPRTYRQVLHIHFSATLISHHIIECCDKLHLSGMVPAWRVCLTKLKHSPQEGLSVVLITFGSLEVSVNSVGDFEGESFIFCLTVLASSVSSASALSGSLVLLEAVVSFLDVLWKVDTHSVLHCQGGHSYRAWQFPWCHWWTLWW